MKPEKKNKEVETIPKMTPWAFVQEEFPSEDRPYILEVEEPIVSWHEIERTSIVDIAIKSFEGCAQATKGELLLLPREG